MRDDRFDERDLERNEDPEVMGGAVGGATGAGVGGGMGMVALGPLGAVIGVLAGLAGGWWAGKGVEQAVEEVDREDQAFRRAHDHTGASRRYEEVRHAYQIGFLAGRNPDHSRADFTELDDDLRAAWVQAHIHDPQPVSWDEVRADARAGFELARKRG